MYKYYSTELANRFVNDYKLPISLTDNDNFEHFLKVFEKSHKSYTKYEKLVDLIETKFNGSASDFLLEYYRVRDKVILDTLSNEDYNKFNTCDMTAYSFDNQKIKDIQHGDVFSETNVGKTFVSIDMTKANFQALRWVDVVKEKTYDEFISKYTDLDYIKDSKYIRQVVFGKLNASRQITVEKFIMFSSVYTVINNFLTSHYGLKLVRFNNDELVYEDTKGMFKNNNPEASVKLKEVRNIIKETIDNVDLHIEAYTLLGYKLKNVNNGNFKPMFFLKDRIGDEPEIMKIPQLYAPIAYQHIFNNIKPVYLDFCFKHEDMKCHIEDDFVLFMVKS